MQGIQADPVGLHAVCRVHGSHRGPGAECMAVIEALVQRATIGQQPEAAHTTQ